MCSNEAETRVDVQPAGQDGTRLVVVRQSQNDAERLSRPIRFTEQWGQFCETVFGDADPKPKPIGGHNGESLYASRLRSAGQDLAEVGGTFTADLCDVVRADRQPRTGVLRLRLHDSADTSANSCRNAFSRSRACVGIGRPCLTA